MGSRIFFPFVLLWAALLPLGCSTPPKAGMDDGGVIKGTYGPRTTYRGEDVASLEGRVHSDTVLRDGDGNVILLAGVPYGGPSDKYTDARELKLKVRELAEQLVSDMRDCSLQGTVALPTSFVSLNNFDETSTFGRFLGEQIIYELNQRGFAVREYRLSSAIRQRAEGEFYLDRPTRSVAPGKGVVVVGTYTDAPDAVFVNARLVRPADGRVLRTANLVLHKNGTVAKMMRSGKGSANAASSVAKLGNCPMVIKDFTAATRPKPVVNATPFDQGEDIH